MEWKRFWLITIMCILISILYVVKHESVHAQIAMYYGCENISYGFSVNGDDGFLAPYTYMECQISAEKQRDLTYLDSLNEIFGSVMLIIITGTYAVIVIKE